MPSRIQRLRSKGWRMPPGAIYVGRPTEWGNPFSVRSPAASLAAAATGGRGNVPRDLAHGVIALYVRWLAGAPIECPITAIMAQKEWEAAGQPTPPTVEQIRRQLAGRDLVCWCPLDQPCHADVLLEIANADPAEGLGA